MTEPFGPFSVSGQQVERLGTSFAPFINRLLDVESAAAGLSGAELSISDRVNLADGGVDARTKRAQPTRWIPAGDSAWQFKAGDLSGSPAANEFENATHARSIVESGGKYVLALGKSLNDDLIETRRKALAQRASDLGINVEEDTFTVYDANSLALWIEEYPPLAASHLLHGMSEVVQEFEIWAKSNRHKIKWVGSESRQLLHEQIDALVTGTESLDLRIEGVSGVGKTRAVMEALRGEPYRPLVVYIHDTDGLPSNLLPRLILQDRAAIVIVDNCSARKHDTLAGLIPSESRLRLITVGEPDAFRTLSPLILIGSLEDQALQEVLELNEPNLWPEARRVVLDACAGNVRLATIVANRIVSDPNISASDVIDRNVIEHYVTAELPSGSLFLGGSALALFTRIGFDAERSNEIQLISDALGLPLTDLQAAAQALTEAGLLGVRGRYRSVEPHPLALYLAKYAWGAFSDQIVNTLLPMLSNAMAERLLTRAAEIGEYAPTKNAIRQILEPDGPFSTLEKMVDYGNSSLLVQMAIVSSDETLAHISSLIRNASDEQLRTTKPTRRSLVWALEKLVWHRRTFPEAADTLLRLAQVEIETFGNNATGTWIELFGLMLPGTAALPAERAAYLRSVALSSESDTRQLAVRAAARGLSIHEFIAISGEIQGGVIVEPRGAPASWDDVLEYQATMIQLLRSLVDDSSNEVAEAALNELIRAIGPLIDKHDLRPVLNDSLQSLSADALSRIWTEIYRLEAQFQRISNADGEAALRELAAGMPPATSRDRLQSLARAKPWDLGGHHDLQRELLESARVIDVDNVEETLLGVLNDYVPSAYDIGQTLALVTRDSPSTLAVLSRQLGTPNEPALIGFLRKRVDIGDPIAFDKFLDGQLGSELPADVRLGLTVRGPGTAEAKARLRVLDPSLPVSVSASQIFSWKGEISDSELGQLLNSWINRIETQTDYDSVVDFAALFLHGLGQAPPEIESSIGVLLELRTRFPDVGRREWDWAELAKYQLDIDPEVVLQILLQLTAKDSIYAPLGQHDLEVLQLAIDKTQPSGWIQAMDAVEAGAWRLQMDGADWLGSRAAIDVARNWVGPSTPRARIAASVASLRDDTPTDLVRFLLESFGTDEQVRSTLFGNLVSGGWVGEESARITRQIEQLANWASAEPRDSPVRDWVAEATRSLRRQLETARIREEEYGR
jgi:hypothetical protein